MKLLEVAVEAAVYHKVTAVRFAEYVRRERDAFIRHGDPGVRPDAVLCADPVEEPAPGRRSAGIVGQHEELRRPWAQRAVQGAAGGVQPLGEFEENRVIQSS